MTKTSPTIGERLKDLRTERHLTSRDVCDQLLENYGFSLSIAKYNEIENDIDKDFGYHSFVYLAKFFGVSVDYLTGVNDVRSPNYKVQAVRKVTGLTQKAICNLIEIYSTNRMTWDMDIINSILESDNFLMIVFYLRKAVTYSKQDIQYSVFNTNTQEMGETLANKHFQKLMQELGEKYSDQSLSDFRFGYRIAEDEYKKGHITKKQYEKVIEEFDKGHFDEEFDKGHFDYDPTAKG